MMVHKKSPVKKDRGFMVLLKSLLQLDYCRDQVFLCQ
jgi:hypothetical protein